MKDRRYYKRFGITDTAILLFTMNGDEIPGRIRDISEESIGIDISTDDKMKLASHGTFRFQFVDRYRQGRQKKEKVVTALAIIIRAEDEGGTCHIGCVVRDDGYRNYALKRKFSAYYNRTLEEPSPVQVIQNNNKTSKKA